MGSEVSASELWATSGSRSFYNSPHYADFCESQGNSIQFRQVGPPAQQIVLPVAKPKVWTYWRSTRIPIPPVLSRPHSIYMGLLLPKGKQSFAFSETLHHIKSLKRTALFPGFTFVQPVLVENGPATFLEEFCQAIDESGLKHSATASRVLHLSGTEADPSLASVSQITDELLREAPNSHDILNGYGSKRRYDIRRAQREGVKIEVMRVDSEEAAQSIYSSIIDLHRDSWTRTGLVPHSLQYWRGFSRAMRDSGGHDVVSRAYGSDGELLAVTVVHMRGRSAFYQMNSSSPMAHKLSASPYSLHAAIVASNVWGTEFFEVGRSSLDDTEKSKNVMRYKDQFGGNLLLVPNFSL